MLVCSHEKVILDPHWAMMVSKLIFLSVQKLSVTSHRRVSAAEHKKRNYYSPRRLTADARALFEAADDSDTSCL